MGCRTTPIGAEIAPWSRRMGTRSLRALCIVASLCGSEAAADVAVEVAAGSQHTCARTAQGGARCWGLNDLQQLGDGTTTPSGVPVEVVGLPGPLTAIEVGEGFS